MSKRPNLLVLLGITLFLVGGAIVFLVLGDDGDDDSATAASSVPVLVATADLNAGQSGDEIIAGGLVEVEEVPAESRVADALGTPESLAGQTLAAPVSAGSQVGTGSLRPESLRSTAVEIPEGRQGVAVTLPFTPGVAGYAAPGDRINMFTVVRPSAENGLTAPLSKLLLTNVEVLDVSNEVAPRRAEVTPAAENPAARATGDSLTYLLSLDAQQAEQVIFATSVDSLYFTVQAKDAPDIGTEGVSYGRGYVTP
ncbi:hypothetical protein BH20ACT2_BH20ACT2_07440 [soil metagenome]